MRTIAKKPPTKNGGKEALIPLPIFVRGYETDPGVGASPTGGSLVVRAKPLPATGPLVLGFPAAPAPAGLYIPGTPAFRYWEAAEALSRGRNMWRTYAGLAAWNPSVGASLAISLDAGVDLNAFYDRHGLRFFHRTVSGITVFSGESPDVACHELGHAVLDAVQPLLWNAGFVEAAAFHEGFGDISAMLSALQIDQLRQDVLVETGGTLYVNSRLSRLAEQLGWAIRTLSPSAVDPDCLRNAVNPFLWRDPSTIPTSGPASTLSSEPHSFSRVISSAFLLAMSNVFSTRPVRDEATLLLVANEMGALLIRAIRAAAVVPRYYASVAARMVALAPVADRTAIRAAFVRKKILSPIIVVHPVAGAMGMAEGIETELANVPAETVTLNLEDYGLSGRLFVESGHGAAARPLGFAPLGDDARPVSDTSAQEAANLFVTELFIRDRVAGPDEDPDTARTYEGKLKTHKIAKKRKTEGDDDYHLERIRIDCGLHGHAREA